MTVTTNSAKTMATTWASSIFEKSDFTNNFSRKNLLATARGCSEWPHRAPQRSIRSSFSENLLDFFTIGLNLKWRIHAELSS